MARELLEQVVEDYFRAQNLFPVTNVMFSPKGLPDYIPGEIFEL